MKKTMTQVISVLFAAYSDRVSPEKVALYSRMLSRRFTPEIVELAAEKLMFESKFLPTIGEISAAAESLLEAAHPEERRLSWEEAWEVIKRELYRSGPYASPDFGRPEIKEAVKAYGWHELCICPEKDLPYARAVIQNAYGSICRRDEERQRNEFVLQGKNLAALGRGVKAVLKAWETGK